MNAPLRYLSTSSEFSFTSSVRMLSEQTFFYSSSRIKNISSFFGQNYSRILIIRELLKKTASPKTFSKGFGFIDINFPNISDCSIRRNNSLQYYATSYFYSCVSRSAIPQKTIQNLISPHFHQCLQTICNLLLTFQPITEQLCSRDCNWL